MSDAVHSYLPEAYFLDGKTEAHMRICREELALLDPANRYCVVAGRGIGVRPGEGFAPFEALPRAERCFLESAMATRERILLVGKDRAVLIFTDLLPCTGLLLAVSPLFSPASVYRALRLLCSERFAVSPSFLPPSPATDTSEAFDALNEILYYLERILKRSSTLGFWTRTRLLANFVGCPALETDFPVDPIQLLPREEQRLFAFLFCTFLTLRTENGNGLAVGKTEDGRFTCRVELCAPFPTDACAKPDYPFLSLPAFRELSLQASADGWTLEGNFLPAPANGYLGSANCAPIGIRLVFVRLSTCNTL